MATRAPTAPGRRGSRPAPAPGGCALPATSGTGVEFICPEDTGGVRGRWRREENTIGTEFMAGSARISRTA